MKLSLLITGVAAAAAMAGAAQAGITVTYEAPGVTNTTALFDVLGKETFDSRAVGVAGDHLRMWHPHPSQSTRDLFTHGERL